MDYRQAFIAEILSRPLDDSARLIYADWLEERGDDQAELIRVQCALAALPDDDFRERPALVRQQRRLIHDHFEEITRPLQQRLGVVEGAMRDIVKTFHRGLIADIAITQPKILAAMPVVANEYPLQGISLHVDASELLKSSDLSWLSQLRRVSFLGRVDWVQWRECLHSNLAYELKEIVCPQRGLEYRELRALTLSNCFSQLQSLSLAHSHIGDLGVRELFRADNLSGLRKLNLSHCDLHDAGVQQICAANLRQLRSLNLQGNDRLTPTAMGYLANWLSARAVRELNLSYCQLTRSHLEQLVDGSSLHDLRRLNLSFNRFCRGETDEDSRWAEHLAQSPQFRNLRELNLDRTGLTESGMAVLCRSPFLRQLVNLNVSDNFLSEAALDMLGNSQFHRLQHLNLSHNGFTTAAIVRFLKTAEMPYLTTLNLGWLEEEAATLLATTDRFPMLSKITFPAKLAGKKATAKLAERYGVFALDKIPVQVRN